MEKFASHRDRGACGHGAAGHGRGCVLSRIPRGRCHGLGCRQRHTPSLPVGRDRRKQVDLGPESELGERALQLNVNTPQRP